MRQNETNATKFQTKWNFCDTITKNGAIYARIISQNKLTQLNALIDFE